MPDLPQELVDAIIALHHNDSLTLINCSTVGRAWTYPSRVHLIREITFNFAPSTHVGQPAAERMKSRLASLQQCLSISPDLAQHIHSFKMQKLRWMNDQWEEAIDILIGILRPLNHIKRLSLQRIHWSKFPDPLKDAFIRLLQLPTLQQLELDAIASVDYSSFMTLLNHPPNLTVLHLYNIQFNDHHRDDSPKYQPEEPLVVRQLRELYINVTLGSTLFNWIMSSKSSFDLTHLKRVHIFEKCATPLIDRLLRLTGGSLEHLGLNCVLSVQELELLRIHLHDLPCLHYLEFSAESPILLIEQLFGGLEQPHPLEEICIMQASLDLKSRSEWRFLDSCFTQKNLGRLRRVEFQMVGDLSDGAIRHYLNHFPVLRERGIIHASLPSTP